LKIKLLYSFCVKFTKARTTGNSGYLRTDACRGKQSHLTFLFEQIIHVSAFFIFVYFSAFFIVIYLLLAYTSTFCGNTYKGSRQSVIHGSLNHISYYPKMTKCKKGTTSFFYKLSEDV